MPAVPLRHSEVPAAEGLAVIPLSIHIGARIDGVDLKRPLSPEQREAIHAALLRWKVLFFHDQHLDHAQQVALGRQFGELTIGHPVFGYVEGHPEVYSVGRDRFNSRFSAQRLVRPWSGWHTDVTAAVNPPAAAILRGVDIPPYGGDTQWTNLVAAYQGLSPTLQAFVDSLRGEHRFTPPEGSVARQGFSDPLAATPLVSEHPLVRVHPLTGEKALFVSPAFLKRIVGLSLRESEQLLALLFEQAIRPEYTVRFKWQAGDVAFWDNRATAHLPPEDIYASDFARQLYRVTLVGEVPVGPDGRQSTAIEGRPVLAHTRE
ncbi:TauD/TfdA family dioxygenase [Pseudomonas sp. MAP12]|uniref:TauD/TfdA family dioxygenase n=1 Tax=Geopseudomonas aromaticivorans TaxID=2849492 RepID=A0ABS6MU74_9GAMM|nr:TauD/TfdA family dioxygenase [Pseudomonas aromaticivorans]MBV2132352.1 TauD/TfdA family dioxygenase [Pseudomonas aromaticivorans]